MSCNNLTPTLPLQQQLTLLLPGACAFRPDVIPSVRCGGGSHSEMPSSPSGVRLARAHPLTKTHAVAPVRQTRSSNGPPNPLGCLFWLLICSGSYGQRHPGSIRYHPGIVNRSVHVHLQRTEDKNVDPLGRYRRTCCETSSSTDWLPIGWDS